MNSETRQCQNCKKDFTIEPEDFDFYAKIKVPPPTFCPECRLIRRLAYREERALYKDTCDLCGAETASLFAPDTPFTVYCSPCWWSDKWDAATYGRDYDFNKSFFEQLYDLQKSVPYQATNLRNSTNCRYCHGLVRSKNCYMVFGGLQAVDCMYCQAPILSRGSIDSDVIMNAEHVYETVNSNSVFKTKFTYFSDECFDSALLFDCKGCSNCFGCVNLRNKKYNIFNVQYSKEEYHQRMKEWDIGSYRVLQMAKEKFQELYLKTPHRYAVIINSQNVLGDDIKNTKNCQTCFSTRHGVENCKYVFLCGLLLKDSYDVNFGGDTSELLYEVTGSTQSHHCSFNKGCNNIVDVEYSENIYTGSHLFGCTKMRNKEYCILNKQYTKEEYEALLPKIKQHMREMPFIDNRGRTYGYGEFFPSEHSRLAYNETWGHQWFPLTKEEALEKGYLWRDPIERNYKVTMHPPELPDHIQEVDDSILNEVIACEHAVHTNNAYEATCNEQCTTAFRILPDELQFYRTMKVALPRLCPNCRYYQRLKKRNPPKLWHRKCMCTGTASTDQGYANTVEHFHGNEECSIEFETSYALEKPEIIYCEKCYQKEFI